MRKSLPDKNKTLMNVQTDCKLKHLMGYGGKKKPQAACKRDVYTPPSFS